jgi:hypothetical protein
MGFYVAVTIALLIERIVCARLYRGSSSDLRYQDISIIETRHIFQIYFSSMYTNAQLENECSFDRENSLCKVGNKE